MSVSALLYSLLVAPLLRIYSTVFHALTEGLSSVGVAIVVFGFILNAALLPVYYQMELASRQGATRRKVMNEEIAWIKKHYRGRERYYYTRTIHRRFGYQPISAVFASPDLFLQMFLFATVYQFLAGHAALVGTPFLLIDDLGQPDKLLVGHNLLPILMTALNLASALYYHQDKRKRRATILLALLFLALLYSSPSGLVLYWTSANAFSFLRNYVERRVVPTLSPDLADRLARIVRQE